MAEDDDIALVGGIGLVFISVCTSLPPERVLVAADARWPTGLDRGWAFSEDPTFATGQPNPCPCEREAGRTHYLLDC